MKHFLLIGFFLISVQLLAQDNSGIYSNPYLRYNSNNNYNSDLFNSNNSRPYKDLYGNSYKYYENMFKDKDNDGLTGYFDNNDANSDPYKSLFKSNSTYTPNYLNQDNNYNSNYNSSYYDFNRSKTIYTGPQGGQYYINSNGNKTYIKK